MLSFVSLSDPDDVELSPIRLYLYVISSLSEREEGDVMCVCEGEKAERRVDECECECECECERDRECECDFIDGCVAERR